MTDSEIIRNIMDLRRQFHSFDIGGFTTDEKDRGDANDIQNGIILKHDGLMTLLRRRMANNGAITCDTPEDTKNFFFLWQFPEIETLG